MDNFKEKGFVHFLTALIIILGTVVGLYLVQQKTNFFPKAEYSTPQLTVKIRAWGQPGGLPDNKGFPVIALFDEIGTQQKQISPTFTVTAQDKGGAQIFTYNLPAGYKFTSKPVVKFLSTASGDRADKKVYIDYITVNGVIYQTEDSRTYSLGAWDPNYTTVGCRGGGYYRVEGLGCTGAYFKYDQYGQTSPTPTPTPTCDPNTTICFDKYEVTVTVEKNGLNSGQHWVTPAFKLIGKGSKGFILPTENFPYSDNNGIGVRPVSGGFIDGTSLDIYVQVPREGVPFGTYSGIVRLRVDNIETPYSLKLTIIYKQGPASPAYSVPNTVTATIKIGDFNSYPKFTFYYPGTHVVEVKTVATENNSYFYASTENFSNYFIINNSIYMRTGIGLNFNPAPGIYKGYFKFLDTNYYGVEILRVPYAFALTTPTVTPKPTVIIITPTKTPTPTPTPVQVTLIKRVFVTSTTYSGNLGGLSGADTKCQVRANAANLGGAWKAWLSDDSVSAASRLTHSIMPYVRLDNTKIANNWASLVSGSIQNPINIDEFKRVTTGYAWTGTKTSGENYSFYNCQNWTVDQTGYYGRMGMLSQTNYSWTDNTNPTCNSINFTAHLYCIEQ